jgi:hypothetical protein
MPGEMEITEEQLPGKNSGHQKSVGGSRKLLQLFRLKPLRWRNKQTNYISRRKQNQSPDERRDQLDRDMKNNWEQLPATLRRRKEKMSQAVLDQFTEDVIPAEDEIKPILDTDLDKQDRVLQNVSGDSTNLAFLEGIQLTADRHSTELLVLEENPDGGESVRISSTASSQIIVTPQIHQECSDSSLDCVENKEEDLNVEPSSDYLVPPSSLEAGVNKEIEVYEKPETKTQTGTSEENNKSDADMHRPEQTETQPKEASITQLELENMTQEVEEFTATCSREITLKYNSHEENVNDASSDFKEKDGLSLTSKNDNCTNLNENFDDNYDKNNIDLSHSEKSETSDSKRCDKHYLEKVHSEDTTTIEKLCIPRKSCLCESSQEDKNVSVHCEIPTSSTNLKLPATKEFNEEAHTASTPLSQEEQQIMALLLRAVSEDSLLIPSSPSSTSAKSVTLSVDERNHDSGTDVNGPSPSTSSSNIESVSTSASKLGMDISSHYKHPRNAFKSTENSDEYSKVNSDRIMQASGTVSQDLLTATDVVTEKSFGSQSIGISTSSPILKNDGKSSKIPKHSEMNAPKSPVNNSANNQPSSSSSNCCFSSVSDDPTLYEVVIPRAEYHKPSLIALKTAEYQVSKDKLPHEVHHDMLGSSATSVTKDKLACYDRNKTWNQPEKFPVKMESLGRDEEDVMSYYDAVVHDGQISNFNDCDDDVVAFGNFSMHVHSKKAVMDCKEYEYIAKGLYINDYVHGEMKNQKSVCGGRSENGHVGTGNAFAKRYAAMEFVSGVAMPTDHTDLSKGKTFTKGDICCKDKMCCDKVKWLPDTCGSKWKRPFGLETLNKKPVTMATIMEEREGEADSSATAANTSDSEKLTVREILRRFEELGGRVHLPADIAHVEVDTDAEKSATLRDIQETLRCLEEKVRHYETKAATTQTQDADENSSGEKVEHRHVTVLDISVLNSGKL